jgi:hypothetical protein
MRYRMRYNVGPIYARRPRRGTGIAASILSALWYAAAFVAQLVVWAVLLVAGIVYTIFWLIAWPVARLV